MKSHASLSLTEVHPLHDIVVKIQHVAKVLGHSFLYQFFTHIELRHPLHVMLELRAENTN